MKVSCNAINQFRKCCKNQDDASNSDIEYKIIRNFTLGDYIKTTGEESFIKSYGTLRMLCEYGVILSVWQDKSHMKNVNRYEQYKYNVMNRGLEYANTRCTQ